ncbi:hypothetical protein DSM104299_04949 [Baekduia alba]|uniref:GtrA family protein n=1 Tax=Baekduia alba TaxID=2997333 RepID=UPI0023419918|nr:GtrA family protein [Baekduia alba]WCB96193.1 hypothetical protein DSM104299_04949 [Baekduia alba]
MNAAVARSGPPAQLVRFAVVGASNTVVTLITTMMLGLALPATVAAALGWGAGAVNGYRLNRGWTFASRARGAAPAARYVGVQALAAGVDAGGVWALSGSSRVVAALVALPVASLLAFVLCRRWVFVA